MLDNNAMFDQWDDIRDQKSGFFRVKGWDVTCTHPEHNFPTHLYIPLGMGYRHVCPGCGKTQTVINNGPTL